VKALVGEGVALTELGRVNDAIARYQRALDVNPNDADAHNSLGYTLANDGRIAEALPHFERAVALNPGDENAKRNLEQARQVLSRR
jgi:tetratricopeptide (TPR) repeat protein